MRSFAHPSRACALALSLVLCALVVPAHAEDIDIYADRTARTTCRTCCSSGTTRPTGRRAFPRPTAIYKDDGIPTTDGPKATAPDKEQGKKFAIEKCAIYNLIDALPVATSGDPDHDALFNIGFMLFNESPDNGGYPRKEFTRSRPTTRRCSRR